MDMKTNASNESKTFKSVRRAGWLTSWGRARKSQRGCADSCGVQRAWREEIKNVLIWSTQLSKEQQGRCLSSRQREETRRENGIPRVLTGATSRDAVESSTRSPESPRKGSTSLAWKRAEDAQGPESEEGKRLPTKKPHRFLGKGCLPKRDCEIF